jgi:hypothetical protein
LSGGVAYTGYRFLEIAALHGANVNYRNVDYATAHNRFIIALAVLEVSFLLIFALCVIKIWWFLKKHPNRRGNEKSMAIKVVITILSLSIRVMVI